MTCNKEHSADNREKTSHEPAPADLLPLDVGTLINETADVQSPPLIKNRGCFGCLTAFLFVLAVGAFGVAITGKVTEQTTMPGSGRFAKDMWGRTRTDRIVHETVQYKRSIPDDERVGSFVAGVFLLLAGGFCLFLLFGERKVREWDIPNKAKSIDKSGRLRKIGRFVLPGFREFINPEALVPAKRSADCRPLEKTRQTPLPGVEAAIRPQSSNDENPRSSTETRRSVPGRRDQASPKPRVLTLQQQLEQTIRSDPQDETNYLDLLRLHLASDRLSDAERVLTKAFEIVSNLRVIEKLEDAKLTLANRRLELARRQVAANETPEALANLAEVSRQFHSTEFEVLKSRAARRPDDKSLQFRLGLSYKNRGEFRSALEPLQAGLKVPEHRAAASLHIGEILQRHKQFSRALECYHQAIQLAAAPPQDKESRKAALYRAGVLAASMNLTSSARNYFTELVATFPEYKDAQKRLDELIEIEEEEQQDI